MEQVRISDQGAEGMRVKTVNNLGDAILESEKIVEAAPGEVVLDGLPDPLGWVERAFRNYRDFGSHIHALDQRLRTFDQHLPSQGVNVYFDRIAQSIT